MARVLLKRLPIVPTLDGRSTSNVRRREPSKVRRRKSTIDTERAGQVGQAGRAGRVFEKGTTPIDEVTEFLTDYVALPPAAPVVIAAWVGASWLCETWHRFPHLAITSPEKRCGKTTLLEILQEIVPRPLPTSNISPAALYRSIAKDRPTLLFDEAQSLSRVGSESSVVLQELLKAGISKKTAKVLRCTGKKMDKPKSFDVFSPKVIAMIGEVESVLADRCLPVVMRRKTADDRVKRYRSIEVEARGEELRDRLKEWTEEYADAFAAIYPDVEPFDISNDRMADLLLPLQTVLSLTDGNALDVLKDYAYTLDERDRQQESQSPGVLLLTACREIFFAGKPFVTTEELIESLKERDEEPWYRWNRGAGLNPESLSRLLRPFEIKPGHNRSRTARGYFRQDFEESWARYLPPLEQPSKASNLSKVSKRNLSKVVRS